MKIALIGNMNNIFFTIMRYLRDLELDAHLFMYDNEYEHFKPEKDTYNIDKYEKYIHILPVSTDIKGLLFLNKGKIKKELEDYDFFIGCGVAPALFSRLNIRLDIFIPYADVVELTVKSKLTYRNFLKTLSRRYIIDLQIDGIKQNTTKIIASAVQEVTKDTIDRLSLQEQHIKKYMPMVYIEKNTYEHNLTKTIDIMSNCDLVLFSHTRHHWKGLIEDYQKKDGGKGLDKLIIGYSEFLKHNPTTKSLLVFFEYGQDVEASKNLISKLNIENSVLWLPLMPRKDILQLISYSDIVVDALSSSMWGGVGWEGLSQGKLIMQNILQSDKEYYNEMGHELPFIMKANTSEQVEDHLNNFIEHKEYFKEKSKENKIWFDKYAGIGLAKEYKEIIEELYKEKNR